MVIRIAPKLIQSAASHRDQLAQLLTAESRDSPEYSLSLLGPLITAIAPHRQRHACSVCHRSHYTPNYDGKNHMPESIQPESVCMYSDHRTPSERFGPITYLGTSFASVDI